MKIFLSWVQKNSLSCCRTPLICGDFVRGICSDTGSHYPEVPKFGSVGTASTIVKDQGFPFCEEKAILIQGRLVKDRFVLTQTVLPVSWMDWEKHGLRHTSISAQGVNWLFNSGL